MTREKWLNIKKNNQFSMELFYEYFKEHGGDMIFEEFNHKFNIYIEYVKHIPLQKIIDYFDNKFNIFKLYGKNGQLFKEY